MVDIINLFNILSSLSLFSLLRPQPRSTLFPYTTLFRSGRQRTAPVEATDPRMDQGRRAHVPEPSAQTLRSLVARMRDRKSTRLNSSHQIISYAVFCLKKKKRMTVFYMSMMSHTEDVGGA